jgi:glycosidase
MWFGGATGSDTPNPINVLKDYTGDNAKIYAQIYQPDVTTVDHEQVFIKAQIGYTSGNINYPVNYNQLTWINTSFNTNVGNNDEYMADFPTNEVGTFKFIARFSMDSGNTWTYCDAVPSPNIINTSDISYGTATVIDENQRVSDFKYNKDLVIDDKSYTFTATYTGSGEIDFTNSTFYLNGEPVDLSSSYNESTKTFTISANGLENNKYTYLFRVIDTNSKRSESVYVPIWIEDDEFKWKDAFIYQIMTDRFNDGDSSNNSPVAGVDTDKNWQGGDFKGIIEKIESGYFADMGVNVLWISSPILNTDGKGIGVSDGKWYSAYHSYWPIATGWTDTNHLDGITTPIDNHFGTEEELKELIRVAHSHGIRVLADFVANHVFAITDSNTATGTTSPWATISSYFHNLSNPYVCGWDQPITCWFTNYLPDFNYSNPILMNLVMDHAIWMIQEYDFDGYRLDAVKHMIMDFTTTIRSRIRTEVQTTGYDFYTVGETFDGDAGFLNSFVGDDKLFGQFEFGFYFTIRDAILHNGNISDLKNFADWNDTYYTNIWSGALMSNFLGNHDVQRALNEAGGNYSLLRLAQTVLMTSPRIPLIYQGDEFGMPGGGDPDNRRFMRFELTDNNEISTRAHLQKLGVFRAKHQAIRKGVRTTCGVGNDFWIYKMVDGTDIVIVGINKGSNSASASCDGVSGNFKDAFTGNSLSFTGSVEVPANSSFVIGKE